MKECCNVVKGSVVRLFGELVEITFCPFCGTKLSPPAEEQVPHIIDSSKEHEALLEIKAILNKLWLPMKED